MGVVPIMLSEISPPAFRSTFAGVAYQTGSMVSSASAQIEASECPPLDDWGHSDLPVVFQLAVNTLARRL